MIKYLVSYTDDHGKFGVTDSKLFSSKEEAMSVVPSWASNLSFKKVEVNLEAKVGCNYKLSSGRVVEVIWIDEEGIHAMTVEPGIYRAWDGLEFHEYDRGFVGEKLLIVGSKDLGEEYEL